MLFKLPGSSLLEAQELEKDGRTVHPATPNASSATLGASSARFLPLPGELFKVGEFEAWLIPSQVKLADGSQRRPWIFFAHTLHGGNPRPVHTGMFARFVQQGISIAGVDVGESFGSPHGRSGFTALYHELVEHRNFAHKPCLVAQSRGGLQAYNWAADHPNWIAGIAGIFTVADVAHYPGLQRVQKAYGRTLAELKREMPLLNPIERLKPLADARVPIFLLHGEKDHMVPLSRHSAVLVKRYVALGGNVRLIVLPDKAHELTPEFLEHEELVAFVTERALQPESGPIASSR
jgi:pimeloyl-ACP methyl ester carboxylesterase